MSAKVTNAKGKNAANKQSKKSNLPLIVTAVVIVCAAIIAVTVGRGGGKGNKIQNNIQVISAGAYLTIPTEDIGSEAVFYHIEVDGTEMEVLAVRASDGTIRTAFNTCQSCFLSGAGYYVQEGNDLVCQNCGFHFTPDQVEIQSGGCNPWPIFAENKTVAEGEIRISYDFLKESSAIFRNWKI